MRRAFEGRGVSEEWAAADLGWPCTLGEVTAPLSGQGPGGPEGRPLTRALKQGVLGGGGAETGATRRSVCSAASLPVRKAGSVACDAEAVRSGRSRAGTGRVFTGTVWRARAHESVYERRDSACSGWEGSVC